MEQPTLTLTALAGIPLIQQGDDLAKILARAVTESRITLQDEDVLILAQKIVSKAEGRIVNLADVIPSAEALKLARDTEKDPRLVQLILQESNRVVRSRPGLIITEHKLGFVCANAGIDRSNVADPEDEKVLLLPENPDASARQIRNYFAKTLGVDLGILIIDSHGRAWRKGTVGISIGFSGLPGLVDLRGDHDLFGYELQATEVAGVDELAAGASLLMGQAAEGTPAVHARGFPYPLRDGYFAELPRESSSDLFR
jgi:coenzyme F420-0:L-glutamate ligase/coenzyme F420-1:gamma-L-glutamate ligase